MRTLRAADITRLVEWGENKHALDQALVLLRLAHPQASREELIRLPMGVRDRLLLEVRRSLFGSRLDLVVHCRACRLALEFKMTIEELLTAPAPSLEEHELEHEAYCIRFRLPNSADLAAVVGLTRVEDARLRLLSGCVSVARHAGREVDFDALPAHIVNALAVRIGELDPLADISFKLQCEACHREIEASFDILHFAWTELKAHAERVQREIHLLAKTYGWSEQRILEMSAARRHRYCQMVSDG
jgi:hypothetical protein